ncbi:MAG TPA: DUF2071 domain-containing protein [Acidimicrobiia bacterium]|nr:DUF2071 domain-containing protein [Acidimicrobiia bacterium]
MEAGSVGYGPECPHAVDRVAMLHRWDRLAFLHWRYDSGVVQQLLPEGLVVEEYQGSAWVGLVPFFMEVRFPRVPRIPWLLEFPETNVRTYVTGPGGESGVWFFSLDAARLAAVVAARDTYRLPYFWSQMRVSRRDDAITYQTRRRFGPRNASSSVVVEIGSPYLPDDLEELDHFLTARWTLFGVQRKRLLMARAEHAPWALHRARALSWKDDLIEAAGLPSPVGEPVVHWSPGVDVRVGFPHRVG